MFEILGKILLMRGRVSRKFYAIVGFGLMLLKYAFEATVVWNVCQVFYQPATFLTPSISLRSPFLEGAPDWMVGAWVLFSLPFMWVALSMSVRRAIDAGISPWFGMWVVVPLINFFVMLMLCFLPTVSLEEEKNPFKTKAEDEIKSEQEYEKSSSMAVSAAIGIGVGMLMSLLFTVLSVFLLSSYGAALFLGMPAMCGTVAGFLFNRPKLRTMGQSSFVGFLAVMFGGASLLLFAVEGVVCLLMAAPLILPVGAIGGVVGYLLASGTVGRAGPVYGALFIVPFLGAIETHEIETYEVVSVVEIEAHPNTIWNTVIAFPEITESPGSYFEYGIAYPIKARIDGTGVGAVRYCEFSTGSFVEPITVWDPPSRLSFDVTEQPEPLTELTPYKHVHPPHLDGTFRSVRGEFRIVPLQNGNTRLEGSTWYQLEIAPLFYWKPCTDKILHDIHLRVLNHIKRVAESEVAIR